MSRKGDKTSASRMETEGLSQGLAEQANVQAKTLQEDVGEIGAAYAELNTGACAVGPGLCAEHSAADQGKQRQAGAEQQATAGRLQQKVKNTADTYSDAMRRWTMAVRNYHVEDLTQQVRQFARQHPALLIGGAVIAGFALTRAIKITGNGGRQSQTFSRQPSHEQTLGQDFLPAEEEVFHG